MDYLSSYPPIKIYSMKLLELTTILVTTKSDSWSHEKEWRVLSRRDQNQYVRVPEETLKEIVFGLRCGELMTESIRNWNNRRANLLKLFQIKKMDRSFNLELVPA